MTMEDLDRRLAEVRGEIAEIAKELAVAGKVTKEDFDNRIPTVEGDTICISMSSDGIDGEPNCLLGVWDAAIRTCRSLTYLTDAELDQLIATLQAYKAAA